MSLRMLVPVTWTPSWAKKDLASASVAKLSTVDLLQQCVLLTSKA